MIECGFQCDESRVMRVCACPVAESANPFSTGTRLTFQVRVVVLLFKIGFSHPCLCADRQTDVISHRVHFDRIFTTSALLTVDYPTLPKTWINFAPKFRRIIICLGQYWIHRWFILFGPVSKQRCGLKLQESNSDDSSIIDFLGNA